MPNIENPCVPELQMLWGAQAISEVIGRSVAATNVMLQKGDLPMVRKIRGRWCVSKRVLIAALEAAPDPVKP